MTECWTVFIVVLHIHSLFFVLLLYSKCWMVGNKNVSIHVRTKGVLRNACTEK